MSTIENKQISIYEALKNIRDGKYIMPAFQRQYVWDLTKIEKLWDSILLDYPIATFLFWNLNANNTSKDTYFCSFLTNVVFNSAKQSETNNYQLITIDTSKTDTAILDGQQRLTSLFISLFGEANLREKHARKNGSVSKTKLIIELNEQKADINEEEYNAKKHDIRFTQKVGLLSPTQFELKKIMSEAFEKKETRNAAIEDAIKHVPADSKDYARRIMLKLCQKIYDEKLINYSELFGMNEDDALEMFIRFNNGGVKLNKSDITMSIIQVYWQDARTKFGEILQGKYLQFGTDFIVRTALMLFGDVVNSNINKEVVESLKNEWEDFKKALSNLDVLLSEMKIDVSRFANSWNVLLPIIFVLFNNPKYEECKQGIKSYLMRAIFLTYFQSGTTGKLKTMRSKIELYDLSMSNEMLEDINDLRISEAKIDDILNAEKGSRVAGEVLYYLSLDWYNDTLHYEQDHLHPRAAFDIYNKPPFVKTEDWNAWKKLKDRLPNLEYFEGRANASKNSMSLVDYYNQKTDDQKNEFRKKAIIPDDVSLELKDFGEFYEKRKALLKTKILELLS